MRKISAHRYTILALYLLLARSLPAQDLNLVAITGYRAVSFSQVKDIYELSSYYFRKVGIGFRIKFIDGGPNPCGDRHSLQTQNEELKCFAEDAERRGFSRKKQITYYMLPPWITGDTNAPQTAWLGGLALGLCSNVAIGNASNNSFVDGQEGESRTNHSATILAHEVFHMLCATHQDGSENLMHSTANRFTDKFKGRIPVLRVTKHQVRRKWSKIRKS